MNIQFNTREQKGVKLTEVTFNSRMLYVVHSDTAFTVVDPFMKLDSKEFDNFDDAAAHAAALITGGYTDED